MAVSIPSTHSPIEISRPLFFDKLANLEAVAARVLRHDWTNGPVKTRINAGLGVLCWEDFEEIIFLARQGLGFGCQKILRGMWERGVVAAHLAKHPDQTGRFIQFNFISLYKLMKAMQANEALSGIPNDYVDQVTRGREEYKEQFTRSCPEKGCGRTIASFTWSTMDIVSMAGASAPELLPLAAQGYYVPMAHAHPSLSAIGARLDGPDGSFDGRQNRAREFVDIALLTAHHIAIVVLKQQAEFSAEKDELLRLLDKCVGDFNEIWHGPPNYKAQLIQPKLARSVGRLGFVVGLALGSLLTAAAFLTVASF